MQCAKSERQVSYQPVSDNCPMYSKRETPLNVGLGLYFHQVTRSKKLIDMISDLNLSINYGKVREIKKDVARSIVERRDGVFIPSILSANQWVFFPSFLLTTHGTAIAVFQQQNIQREQSTIQLERQNKELKLHHPFYKECLCSESQEHSTFELCRLCFSWYIETVLRFWHCLVSSEMLMPRLRPWNPPLGSI